MTQLNHFDIKYMYENPNLDNKMAIRKSKEELQKLTTERLLAYYKAERERFNKSEYNQMFLENRETEESILVHARWKIYLLRIKTELNSREHIIK